MHTNLRILALAGAAGLVISACGGDDEPEGTTDTGTDASDDSGDVAVDVTPPEDCDHFVMPGDIDQPGLREVLADAVESGDIVCLGPGVFEFRSELEIRTEGMTLRGWSQDETILDYTAQDLGGNGMLIERDEVTIRDLTVRNSPGDGIRANDARNIAFINVTVWWDADADPNNGKYGLYPVGCDGVLIEGCLVKGASDAGIYVGQSTHVLIVDSEAWGNVAGIEVENTTDAEVRGCHAHDNTAGILVFNLPGPPVQGGQRTVVHDNISENNNLENFASSGVVGSVPSGSGIIILASDNNEFHSNTIRGNVTAGFIIFTYLNGLFGTHDNPDFEAFSEGNWIHDNTFEDNATDPQPPLSAVVPLPDPSGDIIYDGCHDQLEGGPEDFHTNCLSDNGDATYLDVDFCGRFEAMSDDISLVTCTYEALPGQTGRVE